MTTLIELQSQIRAMVVEPASIKKFTCKEFVLKDLQMNVGAVMGMGALRNDCMVYCYDYNAEDFNAALNDLMKEKNIKMVGLNSFSAV